MKILLQRVTSASVTVEQKIVGQISQGLLLLVAASPTDNQQTIDKLTDKLTNLRIFNDPQGKFNLSLIDINGEALVVSQFTLYANAKKGRRPSFTAAAPPDHAKQIVDNFTQKLKDLKIKNVQTGIFGANMQVALTNDGPVTIMLDSEEL